MKKLLLAALLSTMVLSLAGCERENVSQENSSDGGSGESDTQSKTRFRTEEYLDGCEPDDYNAANHDNARIDYSTDEVVKIIGENSDFKLSDNFTAYVPKSLGHVSTFYMGRPLYPSGEKVIEDFNSLFKYLYPDDEVNEDILEFTGPDLDTGEFVRGVMSENNYHNDVLNGVIQPTEFIYPDKFTNDNTPQHQLVMQPPQE